MLSFFRPSAAPPGRTCQLLRLDRSQKAIGGVYLTQVLPFAGKRPLPLFFEFERRCRTIKRAAGVPTAGGGRAREC
jgi:hypothetical protein